MSTEVRTCFSKLCTLISEKPQLRRIYEISIVATINLICVYYTRFHLSQNRIKRLLPKLKLHLINVSMSLSVDSIALSMFT